MTSMSAYISKLTKLSSNALDRDAVGLVSAQRNIVARQIAHLAEVARRRLHLDRGYSGLFEYCTKRLKLSEGSAAVRVQVARVCRECPELLDRLAASRISLTVASKLAPHLTKENSGQLIAACEGMSKREVELYLVNLAPKKPVSAGYKKKSTIKPQTAPKKATPATSKPDDTPLLQTNPAPTQPARSRVEPCQPQLFNVRFTASEEFTNKLERLGEVLGVHNPQANVAEILERALDLALEKKDPVKRQERREARKPKKPRASATSPSPDEVSPRPNDSAPSRSRFISIKTTDAVLERAGHQCEFVGPDGIRCSQRTGLQIHHLHYYAAGGSHEIENLRAYCGPHNRRDAEQLLGLDFVRGKIRESKQVRERSASYGRRRAVSDDLSYVVVAS